VEVTFQDGEVLVGTVRHVSAENLGFFLTPADPASNNLRVFVVAKAVAQLRPLTEPGRPPEARVAASGPPAAAPRGGVRIPRRLVEWLVRNPAGDSLR
jgi:hypothetical protein